MQLTAVFVHVPEGGLVAFVEELPGANTQVHFARGGPRKPTRGCRSGHRGQS